MKKIYCLLFLIALITALVLFFSPSVQKSGPDVVELKTSLATSKEELKVSDETYQIASDSLRHATDSLNSLLQKNRLKLTLAEAKLKESTGRLWEISERIRNDSDTILKLQDCDSLVEESGSLITALQEKDSLSQLREAEMDKLIETRNHSIILSEIRNRDLHQKLLQSFGSEEKLVKRIQAGEQKFRSRTRMNRILGSSLLLLSGFTTSLILRKQ